MPSPASSLSTSLDASLGWSALYPERGLWLSNHLPMVLTALSELGAMDDALTRWVQRGASRLVAAETEARAAVQALAHELAIRGLGEVLQDQLPGLMAAPETSAFHGLIRLACALVAGHTGEQAHALAAWHRQRTALGPPPRPGGQRGSLREVLAHAAQAPALAFEPRQGTTITSDLQACVALPGFDDWVSGDDGPQAGALTVDALAEASLAVYLACRDFTALHLVTGLHAWRLLSTWPADPSRPANDQPVAAAADPLPRGLWRAWLAAWVSIGRPAPDWDAVHAGTADEGCWVLAQSALLASRDEHRIKLAWSARAEWRHRRWPGYARVLEMPR
jgi:Questin oxidase-like